ncbi:MAG TPA: efflux RND transporter periplasmic adaptor subunit [Micropepsaceae bacterium]|nr:efflux RND transporter periplasmic adaptor subunit [Micropepsaceae bacterium]
MRTEMAVRLSFFAAALALLLSACSPGDAGQAPPASVPVPKNVSLTPDQRQHITLYTVAPANYRRTIETTGAVDFDGDQSTSVLAPISGPVSRLLVSVGQRVKKGDVLALVESPDFATAVSTYRKAIATAKTTRRVADLDKDLFSHQGVPQREMEQAQTDAANAEADRDAALQALVALDVDPQSITDIQDGKPVPRVAGVIRAPIAGTVVERLITPGQLLSAGTTPCFTIADVSRVWVMAQIFDSNIASVAVGDPAQVITGVEGKTFAGTVNNIAALVDPNTRSVAVRVVANNPGEILKKQMYVRVRINSRQQSSGLLVPDSAILRDDENLPFVYVVQPDGSFARQRVTLGYRTGDQYDITSGLKPGDRIVTQGGVFVQFMQNQ